MAVRFAAPPAGETAAPAEGSRSPAPSATGNARSAAPAAGLSASEHTPAEPSAARRPSAPAAPGPDDPAAPSKLRGSAFPATGVLSAERRENLKRPVAADLLRTLASLTVCWYHLWQQSWVGAGAWDHWPRTGAVWVDVLILLSAFCLFLPYANAAASGAPLPAHAPKAFWRRRAVRILPSYLVNLAASVAIVLTREGWSAHLGKDLAAHLTLTQMFFPESYTAAKLNAVTWTLTIFALLYLVFPWLVRAMVRCPVQCCTALLAVQLGYTLWAAPQYGSSRYSFLFNQWPAFCGVFAVGFLGAVAFAYLGRRPALQTASARVCFTALGLIALWGIDRLLRLQNCREYQLHQLTHRMPLALAACAFLVCMGLGVTIPGKTLWRFFAGISFNLYLWHQMLAVWIKYDLHLPAWTGELPPNQLGDTAWMQQYNLLAWAVALGSAVLFTYGVEKPAARALKRLSEKKKALP